LLQCVQSFKHTRTDFSQDDFSRQLLVAFRADDPSEVALALAVNAANALQQAAQQPLGTAHS
jgi:hypothetical protein